MTIAYISSLVFLSWSSMQRRYKIESDMEIILDDDDEEASLIQELIHDYDGGI